MTTVESPASVHSSLTVKSPASADSPAAIDSPASAATDLKDNGFLNWLRSIVIYFAGGGSSLAPQARTPETLPDQDESDDAYVIAPGGYRIRLPKPSDISHNVGEMLPAVRQGLSQLPPLPHVVIELLREIQDPKSTSASVATIVSSDPALAASLIRTVNSASMGLSRNITSVSDAVSYLGFGVIKAMVIRLRLNEVLATRTEQTTHDAEDLWVHSLAVSYAAECLAARVTDVDAGFVATLGLLHDIGKLAILAQLPAEADAIRQNVEQNDADSPLACEAHLLGVDHAGLGADLAAMWRLPADLIQAIRTHHRFADAYHPNDPLPLRKALHIMQIANQLTKYCYAHTDHMHVEEVPPEIFSLLELEPSLPKLLDAKMCAAISRAIFFADANTQRPPTAPRRFLRPLRGEQAVLVVDQPQQNEPRVTVDDAAIESLFSAETPRIEETTPTTPGMPRAQFACVATKESVGTCLQKIRGHLTELDLPNEKRSAAMTVVRSLLPNLLQISQAEESIEVAHSLADGKYSLAVRCPGLAASRRLRSAPPENAPRRLAEADLANVLNLRWFDRIAISADGAAILFEA